MSGRRTERWVAATIGLAVLLLGTIPVAAWVPGDLTDAAFARRWQEWALGTAICLGAGIVTGLTISDSLARRLGDAWSRGWRRLPESTLVTDSMVALLCLLAYAAVAKTVLDGKPLLIDELVQVLQARTYAGGQLSVPTDSARAFFSVLHMVDTGARTYSQFPPGWPAMMAIPSMIGAEWVVGPACGAIAVFCFARISRRVFPDAAPSIVPLGALLFGLAPFALFQFASHMSHGPLLMWLLLAVLLAVHANETRGRDAVRRAGLAGCALGAAFAVRPLDAVAFGIPLFLWIGLRSAPPDRARSCFSFIAGGLLPASMVAWVNASTTGSPFTFGYEVLWGASHGLGFHAAPWGDAHTPARGVELLSAYVTRLNVYLFESPFPALLPAVLVLILAATFSPVEWLLLGGSAAHAALYFAYWHDGFYLGPRFVLPWVPISVLLTIRAMRLVASGSLSPRFKRAIGGGGVVAVALSALISIPSRAAQYRSGLTSMRVDYSAEAEKAGVSDAVVFVRESWGARLVARLWALGVSRTATATLYAGVDACVLEHAVPLLEQGNVRGVALEDSLRRLLGDSSRVRASVVSPDTTERMLPGLVYDATCSARVAEDRDGYALYPPFLLDRSSGNIYARDLLDADTVLMNRFPGRRVFRVSRDGVDGSAPLRWHELVR